MPLSINLKENLEFINSVTIDKQLVMNSKNEKIEIAKERSCLGKIYRRLISIISFGFISSNPDLDQVVRKISSAIRKEIEVKPETTSEEKQLLETSLIKLYLIYKKNTRRSKKLLDLIKKINDLVIAQQLALKIASIHQKATPAVTKHELQILAQNNKIDPKPTKTIINLKHEPETPPKSTITPPLKKQEEVTLNVTPNEDTANSIKPQKNPLKIQEEVASTVNQNEETVNPIKPQNPLFEIQVLKDFVDDEKFFLTICEKKPEMLLFASERLKNDQKFIKALVDINPIAIQYAHKDCQGDEEIALTAVSKDGLALQFLPHATLKTVLAAVKQNSQAYPFAKKLFPNNGEVVFEALKHDIKNAKEISLDEEMKNNKDFFRKACQENPELFSYASEVLKKEKEFIKELIEINVLAIQHADLECKNDETIALVVVAKDGMTLEFLPNATIKVIMSAIQQNCKAYEFAKKLYPENEDMALEAIKTDIDQENHIELTETLQNNKIFFNFACKINPELLFYASDLLKKDKNFIKELVAINPRAIQHADKECKEDEEIALMIVGADGMNLELLPNASKTVVLAALKQTPSAFKFAGPYCADEEVAYEALFDSCDQERFNCLSHSLKHNDEFIRRVGKNNPEILIFLSSKTHVNKIGRLLKKPIRFKAKK